MLPGYAFNFTWKVGYVPLQTAPEDELLATTATLYRNYRILAYRDVTDDQFVARGNAEIHFALIRGNWKIVQWRDHEASDADFNRGELSFGQLRLAGP